MFVLYLIQKRLNKLSDYDFQTIWTNHFIKYSKRYFYVALAYFIVAVSLISQLFLLGSNNVFLTFIVMGLVTMFYGYYFIRGVLRFIAINNTRLLQNQMGNTTETFSKDNVVG